MKTLILIGGKSRRMGRDKALIQRPDGTRQIDHLVDLIRRTGGDPTLSLPEGANAPVDLPVLRDSVAEGGPLGALASLEFGPVLVVGCDLFLIDEPTIRELIDRRDPSRAATCFANRVDGRPEPLCAIYESAAIARAKGAFAAGERCARQFLEALAPLVLELPRPAALDNANTPHELAECFAKLEHGVVPKSVKVLYFAKLREARGLEEETVNTLACTPAGLYEEIRFRHRLPLQIGSLRAARNGDFCGWDEPLTDGDEIVFIPPVAGG